MLDPWKNPAIWHAINIHFPIVLAILGLPLVCVVAITRGRSRRLRWAAVLFYLIVAASAWFTVQTGERAMAALPPTISPAASQRIEFHERMAQQLPLLAAVTALFLLLANIPRRWARQTFTTIAVVFSVITAGWIAVTAHSGGLAVYDHGLGTVAMSATNSSQPLPQLTARSDAPVTQPTPTNLDSRTRKRAVSYSQDIKPLLASKCSECHAGSELKGGFDVSTVASIAKGGKKAGAALIAGKPDDSPIVQYLEGTKRPQMPKGGKALDPAEVALVRQWIASGAIDDSTGTVASAAKPAPATTQETISADWDPQAPFSADENVAVRRFVRLKNLKPAPPPPKVDAIVYNPIDQFIAAKWNELGSAKPQAASTQAASTQAASTQAATQPALDKALCNDSTFVRRIYLDLVGMIPTADEARRFVEDKDVRKREKLIDGLLARTKDYAGNWVPFWEDALCSNGLHQGGVGTHGNYRQWIFSSFEQNKPYDTFVQELLDPSMPGHPPRYVLNDNHMRTIQSSADTAQVFLGTAIKCASCHSHFLNDEWPQARAVGFAGFFSDKDMELIRCERKSGQFIATHFMFDLPAAPTSAPSDPNARLKRIAQLITDPTNPRFAKTLVNRLWKRYMGLGLFEPQDDYREDTPPSHPELLDWLADDFIRHGFDVKRTVRLILSSRTYQLRYDPAVEDHFDVAKPKAPRYFRSPALRRLSEEQLLDSIAVTMQQRVPDRRAYQDDHASPLTQSLGKPPTRNEVSTQRPDDTAVVQALELMNGTEFHERVYKGDLITSQSVQPKTDQLIEDVYWSVYSRPPSEKERAGGQEFLKAAPKPATTEPVEVVWLDDEAGVGGTPQGPWKFVAASDGPVFSGKQSHTLDEPLPPGANQHLLIDLKLPVTPDDTFFAYVYLDPANPPTEIMLQFLTGKDWDRVSWGSDEIPFGHPRRLGDLPKAGQWVRLEVPATKVGVNKPMLVTGLAFTQFNGKVYWDKSGAAKGPPIHDPAAIGDMLWAMFTSPEFQYIK